MKVLVIGASGFVGSHVVKHLLSNGCQVRCLIRPTSSRARLPAQDVECTTGDVNQPETLARGAQGVDAAVNIVHMSNGEANQIAKAIHSAGVRRFVAVGTTAIYTTLPSSRRKRRMEAEAALLASGLEVTIVRPTMIYGTHDDRNICRLIIYISRYPVLPVVGSGRFLSQPVHVDDVAQSIFKSLQTSKSIGKAYNVCGQNALSYVEIIQTISRLMCKRLLRLHLPAAPVIRAMQLAERFKVRLPIKSEQIQRINEDKAFSNRDAEGDLGYRPRSFANGIAGELAEMGLLKNN